MTKTLKQVLLGALLVVGLVPGVGRAALTDFGPVSAVTGYPEWYRDSSGTALQLCLNNLQSPLGGPGAYMCLAPPTNEGFPGSRGDENFYFMAAAEINGAGMTGMWEGALEATYAAFPFVKSDAITFARIRIRIDTPVAGDYKVTHPYGVDVFTDVPAGTRGINYTLDVGVAAGLFDLTLNGPVGPWLEWDSDTELLTLLDPLDPTATPYTFVGDPSVEHTVKGSPFGTNFVRVEGPGGRVFQTELFSVLGHKFTGTIPQPLQVARSTYSTYRHQNGRNMTCLDVGALAPAGNQLLLSGKGLQSVALDADDRGHYVRHVEFESSGSLPAQLTVTNLTDAVPFSRKVPLTDDVKISAAAFDSAARTLSVTVETSDQVGLPDVSVLELQDAAVWARVDKTVDTLRPWVATYVATLGSGPVVPPLSVKAQSARGGVETSEVDFPGVGTEAPAVGLQLADFHVVADEDPEAIDVLQSGALMLPNDSVVVLVPPANGSVEWNAASPTLLSYRPAVGYQGTDSFEFVVKEASGAYSSVATVTLDVVAPNVAPFAVDDNASTTAGVARIINVTGNDFDFDGMVVPATVQVAQQPANGSATVNADGSITYRSNVGFPATGVASATDSFTYTVRDNLGAVSAAATVTVRVDRAVEVLTFTRTEAIRAGNRWRIEGRSSIPVTTNSVSAYRGTSVSTVTFIGSAFIDALGNFAIDAPGTQPVPATGTTVPVTIVSDGGARVVVLARIR